MFLSIIFFAAILHLTYSYTMIFEQNFGTQSINCSTDPVYRWETSSSTVRTYCTTVCDFDSPYVTASTLKISDNTYTFKFTIPTTTMYSIIGVDFTYIASQPDLLLTFLGNSPITTSSTADVPTIFETGSVTCPYPIYTSNFLNAQITANANIGASTGTLTVEQVNMFQAISIRSLRLWVNCSKNCLTCSSATLCSACLTGFGLHTYYSGATLVETACETVVNCPSNCGTCYTLQSIQYCVKCNAGYSVSSTTHLCVANTPTPPTVTCSSTSYIDATTGHCSSYSNRGYYQQKSGTSWISLPSTVTTTNYKCNADEMLFIYDNYNYKLFRCGCDVTNCAKCTTVLGVCTNCNNGYYKNTASTTCYSCTSHHCADCTASGGVCTTCTTGYTFNASGVCIAIVCGVHETLDTVSNSCVCVSGFIRDSSNVCNCPVNESFNAMTNVCDCVSGYTRMSAGSSCVVIPTCGTNEVVDASTNTCVCVAGYTRVGASTTCVIIPTCGANEVLNSSANTCDCVSGYTRVNASTTCVIIPTCGANETLNSTANTCDCISGYTRVGASVTCVVIPTCTTNEVLNSAANTCDCVFGYTRVGASVTCVVIPTCGSNEVLNSASNTCDCVANYTRVGASVTCVIIPACGTNEVLNVPINSCECNVGYVRVGSICEVIAVCGNYEILNSASNICDCLSGYSRATVFSACQTTVSIVGVIRSKKDASSSGFTIELEYNIDLTTYSGEDIKSVLVLQLVSGMNKYTYEVTSIQGKIVSILLVPLANFIGETAVVNVVDYKFKSTNRMSDSQEYSVILSDFTYVSAAQQTANDAAGTVGSVASAAIISSILPIAILSNFYVIINTIDLTGFLYYLLFVDVRYPSNVLAFYNFFQNFQFPFIPNIFEYIIDAEYTQEAAKPFENNNTQLYFLSNSGQSVSIVIFVLSVYCVGKVLSRCEKILPSVVVRYLQRAMRETWEFSALFDLQWTLYIYIIVGVMLQFNCYEFSEDAYLLNYALHSIFAVIVIGSPLFILYILAKNSRVKSDVEFKRKYSSLIGGLVLFDESSQLEKLKKKSKISQQISNPAGSVHLSSEPMSSNNNLVIVKQQQQQSSHTKLTFSQQAAAAEREREQRSESESTIGMSSSNSILGLDDSFGRSLLDQHRRLYWRTKLTKTYMGILYTRKLLFAMVIVFLTPYPYVQLCLASSLNVLLVGFIWYIMPLESKWENVKSAIGEVILIIVQGCVYTLVEDGKDSDEDSRYLTGWVIIGLSGFIIGWHTLQLVLESMVSAGSAVKNLFCPTSSSSSSSSAKSQNDGSSENDVRRRRSGGGVEGGGEKTRVKVHALPSIDGSPNSMDFEEMRKESQEKMGNKRQMKSSRFGRSNLQEESNENSTNFSSPMQQPQLQSIAASTASIMSTMRDNNEKDETPKVSAMRRKRTSFLVKMQRKRISMSDFNKLNVMESNFHSFGTIKKAEILGIPMSELAIEELVD